MLDVFVDPSMHAADPALEAVDADWQDQETEDRATASVALENLAAQKTQLDAVFAKKRVWKVPHEVPRF